MPPPGVEFIYRPRIVVKYRDGVGLPYDASATDEIRHRFDPTGALWSDLPGLVFEPLVRSKTPEEILRVVERAVLNDDSYEPPDFLTYFMVEVPNGMEPESLARRLSDADQVEFAYVDSPPGDPPGVHPENDPRSADQGYLNVAPEGIDARFAWTEPGGDGAGVSLVDVERGWVTVHEDLKARHIDVFSGHNHEWFQHGTAILGIIAAVDNRKGCVGIVPGIQKVRCASEWRDNGQFNTTEAIMDATAELAAGDVLLLEVQTAAYTGYTNAPSEVLPAVLQYVKLATASGVTVVSAAGNGGHDLDRLKAGTRGNVFKKSSPDFRDSGAILVGGCKSATRARSTNSCYGSRVDCFAWGQNVMTTSTNAAGTELDGYSRQGGTSTAVAIIAGAAVAVQGVAQARYGKRYKPKALRKLLSNPANTSSANPAADRIGVMPNLLKIITQLMTLTPP